jgi:PKHD-type hydroxylase
MIHVVSGVLKQDELRALREGLAGAKFVDGKMTAGNFAKVKSNEELDPQQRDVLEQLRKIVMNAIFRSERFQNLAMPLHFVAPMFNRYEVGQSYGDHLDSPLMRAHRPVRTDLAMTLFLSEPDSYDGGELVIDSATPVATEVKLPAGDLVLYPATTIHRVQPVTRGVRLAAFAWMQSMVREPELRFALGELYDLRKWAERVAPGAPELLRFQAVQANLLRTWADT